MLYTKNMNSFGSIIQKIRTDCRLTQKDVNNQTGISINTLRLIENGKVIPQYETLSLLSITYKVDLQQIFMKYRSNQEIFDLYSSLNKLLVEEPSKDNISYCKSLIDSIDKLNDDILLIYPEELDQIKILIETIISFDTRLYDLDNVNELVRGIKKTNIDFDVNNLIKKGYTIIEAHSIYMIALYYSKNKLNDKSNELLFNLLETIHYFNDEYWLIKQKIYFHISYNFHIMDNHKQALFYSNKGIQFTLQNDLSMKILPNLYARYAVAQYFLNDDEYHQSMLKVLVLLQIQNRNIEFESYQKIFKNKYKFVYPKSLILP